VRSVDGLRKTAVFCLALSGFMALAVGASTVRRRFIQTWFRDAGAQRPPPLTQPPPPIASVESPAAPLGPDADHLGPVRAVRVLLLDGLSAAQAATLPRLGRLCETGADLEIDVGFPTVSLPVQAALWTGLTQQQSGLWYRTQPPLQVPADASPARVRGSVAVAEEQPFIAGSFGFSSVVPSAAAISAGAWNEAHFTGAAGAAITGPAPLAFVHVLRIDKAGHRSGAASPAYAQAAAWADRFLAGLLVAAPPGPNTRWFVLADHGHRPGGGHAGIDDGVRIVRGCISGGGIPAGVHGRVHLVDVARALTDSLGLPAPDRAVGRPLGFALLHPDPDATLPAGSSNGVGAAWAFGAWALICAVLVVRRRRWLGVGAMEWAALAWLPLAEAAIWIRTGALTLSNPVIYPPRGLGIVLAGLPGLLLLLVLVAWQIARAPGWRGLGAGLRLGAIALVPPLLAAATALLGCGGIGALASVTHDPPLRETFTGQASVLIALVAAAAAGIALSAPLVAAGTRLTGGESGR
jgi:hypothetical protein